MTAEHTDAVIFEIVAALAAADDVAPSNLDYELAEYINPIALGNLFTTTGEYWECSFEVPLHEVTVTHTGGVYIDGTHRRTIGETKQQDADYHIRETPRDRQFILRETPGMLYRGPPRQGRPLEFVSAGCEDVTGYPPNAFTVGEISYGGEVIHAADHQRVWNTIQTAIRRGDQFCLRYRIETADHEEQLVRETVIGVALGDDAVALVGVIISLPEGQSRQSS